MLSVHLALTNDTRNFVGASILNRLAPGPYFVNTSRGEIVDHAALAGAVRTGGIKAALDVFPLEPSSPNGAFNDPILALPNVIGTHHIGGSTDQAQEAIATEAARVIREYKDTGKVPNVVNLATTTPATHMLVVRHRDRPGVLAHVFEHLRAANLNGRKPRTSSSPRRGGHRPHQPRPPSTGGPAEYDRAGEPGHSELVRR